MSDSIPAETTGPIVGKAFDSSCPLAFGQSARRVAGFRDLGHTASPSRLLYCPVLLVSLPSQAHGPHHPSLADSADYPRRKGRWEFSTYAEPRAAVCCVPEIRLSLNC